MDANVMEQRLKQWMPIFEEQAKSGLNKQDWCDQNGVKRAFFLNGKGYAGLISFQRTRLASPLPIRLLLN